MQISNSNLKFGSVHIAQDGDLYEKLADLAQNQYTRATFNNAYLTLEKAKDEFTLKEYDDGIIVSTEDRIIARNEDDILAGLVSAAKKVFQKEKEQQEPKGIRQRFPGTNKINYRT